MAGYMGTSGPDTSLRDIRLTENPDGQWTARDLDAGVSAQSATREAALAALDDVVAAIDGEAGHDPTDGELRKLGVDPEVARCQPDEVPDVLR